MVHHVPICGIELADKASLTVTKRVKKVETQLLCVDLGLTILVAACDLKFGQLVRFLKCLIENRFNLMASYFKNS